MHPFVFSPHHRAPSTHLCTSELKAQESDNSSGGMKRLGLHRDKNEGLRVSPSLEIQEIKSQMSVCWPSPDPQCYHCSGHSEFLCFLCRAGTKALGTKKPLTTAGTTPDSGSLISLLPVPRNTPQPSHLCVVSKVLLSERRCEALVIMEGKARLWPLQPQPCFQSHFLCLTCPSLPKVLQESRDRMKKKHPGPR